MPVGAATVAARSAPTYPGTPTPRGCSVGHMTAVTLMPRIHNPGGDGRALVLHGVGSDGTTMWQISEHLANTHAFRVNAPDLRGHGLSPTTATYGIGDHAMDVAAFAAGNDLVIGHSLGGAILAQLLPNPEVARLAVLLDPVLWLPDDEAEAIGRQMAQEEEITTAAGYQALHPSWHPEDCFRKARAAAACSPRTIEQTFLDSRPWDVRATASMWACPVVIVASDPAVGTLFQPSLDEELAGLPNVTVHRVAGAGHSVHRDATAAVLDLIDRALAEHL